MAKVLHLLESEPDYQSQLGSEQLTRNGAGVVHTIGRGGVYSNIFMGAIRLRKEAAPYDLIHAWGENALTLAALTSGKRIIYSPTRFPNLNARRWLRATVSVRDVQVVCPTHQMHRAMVKTGIPIERCHLIRPGVDFARLHKRRDDDFRAALGFSKDDFLILPCGEQTQGANHHLGIVSATVLHVYHPRYKLLLWGRGPKKELERRFCALMLPNKFITFATDKFGSDISYEKVLSAADMVFVTADAPAPTLSIAITMASGIPIISTVSPTVAELLEDRHNCLMVTRPTSRLISRKALDLNDDAQLRWKLTDTAKTEAYEYFSMSRFVDQYRAVYEQAAMGKRIEIPQPAPGAGARFHGLAGR